MASLSRLREASANDASTLSLLNDLAAHPERVTAPALRSLVVAARAAADALEAREAREAAADAIAEELRVRSKAADRSGQRISIDRFALIYQRSESV